MDTKETKNVGEVVKKETTNKEVSMEKKETKKVSTFKVGDIKAGKVTVPSRGNGGTSELGNLIRSKATELLKSSGDAVLMGEFVSSIKGDREYREVYVRTRMAFQSKNGTFIIQKYMVDGKERSFLVRK